MTLFLAFISFDLINLAAVIMMTPHTTELAAYLTPLLLEATDVNMHHDDDDDDSRTN